ncbi:MAG: PorV/PorQ family protein [Saprospiraceae bacterium]
MRKFYFFAVLALASITAFAGNPDRQGEAGAYELLLNPFARSAGLASMTTSNVAGAEAMRINVAGLGRVTGLEVTVSNMQYLVGTDINMNAIGFAAPMKNGAAFGMTIAALSFGDIPLTTTNTPEGNGSSFAPTFFHIALGYSKTFEDKISVGVGLRFISEQIFNASATGFAVDAGVQYVSGEEDEFKLGISLRNVGLGMRFSGDGISEQFAAIDGGGYQITAQNNIADFELPFQLNIGASYDVNVDENNKVVLIGNFTSNAFSRDNLGGGIEYSFRDVFMVRGGYNAEVGVESNSFQSPLTQGLAAGASAAIPLGGVDTGRKRYLFIDYAYRPTRLYDGSHNLGLRLNL